MAKYVALLRGIGPANPNMHGSKLKAAIEELGFTSVQSVISSGNVIFESAESDTQKLEAKIQAAWPIKLGFNSLTIVRSKDQLRALVELDPYQGTAHGRENYQLVTFFKKAPKSSDVPSDRYYFVKGVNALCSSLDTTSAKTVDFMSRLEKTYSKDITSRTYKTVERILNKMG